MRARTANSPRGRWAKGSGAVAAGTIALALFTASPAGAATVPIGSVDVVSQTADGIRISGWAIDPDTTNAVSVRVYVDGVASVTATANTTRTDVGGSYSAFGNDHGFDLTLTDIADGTHTVCAYALNDDATNNSGTLGCKTVTVSGTPIGFVDVASQTSSGVRVAGWSIDPNTTDAIDVHVYVDGTYATSATANASRTDVADAYPGYGDTHGFDLTLTDIADGTHTVCVYGINDDATNNNPAIGCKTVTVSGTPIGFVDVASQTSSGVRVAGWSIDPNTTDAIDVHVYVDGTYATSATANASRTDVADAYPGYGDTHGFDLTLTDIANGTHTVCVYGINDDATNNNPAIGCATVTVA